MVQDVDDWVRPFVMVTDEGTVVVVDVGENYFVEENALGAGADPTYTPTFTLKNIRIMATTDMIIKFNDAGNDAWTAEANKEYSISGLIITSIIITNVGAGDIKIFGTD